MGEHQQVMLSSGNSGITSATKAYGLRPDVANVTGAGGSQAGQSWMRDITLIDNAQLSGEFLSLENRLNAFQQQFRPIARTDDQGGWGMRSGRRARTAEFVGINSVILT